ncbi:2-amino-4-hydroxy-6-hydroxymethyldihydropteridine diphosphokinase [Bacteroides sp. 214]|uniref:2-amino-4-hydroxy-6- hydroxymethyldihydropteridine diphosphokinase n=1 Tax=Bacteroides sp. 214 TaxID=2302935 RepID=UPI0013D0E629|nr:2-amino-4-hydroxy-6-hydroxymethyldihydropteridine diphosphokinase [Bacteroides sp. 214]NDW13862.1 2-amino-4-hydroxy-6-hydroxymethyldihydropteridine diphosphokinase [Bacteroides sp. 214]
MAKVYLGLGTNLGNKDANLRHAVQQIESQIGEIISLSGFYATEPWGFESPNSFLNAVVCIETTLPPRSLLTATQQIEKVLGRKTKTQQTYTDRIIDIDILLYDNLVINEPDLVIPHPLMTTRDFVMKPLAEIAPELV